ncbi:recombinase family protein [Synechococcus sp. CC9605]|uniref:recombinase family protein n=1 Tax=Synechococcus sp. (strain CC9605) TaxID=110662 RepID=UPI00059C6FF2|nr:recombinase family protein [Synechococcus sp. CC9605]
MASVVGYARLSTVEQARGTLTLEQQVSRLKSAGAGEVLVDLMSGTSEARPRYRELIRRVKAGTMEKVVATRWDRLTRGAAETCKLVDVFSADGAPSSSCWTMT